MTDPSPRWDADLGPAALLRLPPAERRLRILASLRRKVEGVEAAALAVKPGDPLPDVPWDKAALRRLHVPGEGMWPWSDRVVDADDGPNADLIRRWRLALESIRTRRRGGARALRDEIALRDRRVADLELQVAALLDERRSLREALLRLQARGAR